MANKDTRFKPGESGNPAGRPRGKTLGGELRRSIEKQAPAILQVMIDNALAGDVASCQFLINRVVPALKPVAAAVELPTVGGLAEQGSEVIQSALSGAIAPDTAASLLSALSSQCKIVEVDELVKRIEALEGRQNA